MKHPNIENIRVLADTFLLLSESDPEAKVNMKDAEFHPCGTTACHAGWFAVSQGKESAYNYGFMDAAKEMARFLGFNGHHELTDWVEDNRKLWGNRYGARMFGGREAFGLEDREPTLKEIGEHWLAVADRIEGLKDVK